MEKQRSSKNHEGKSSEEIDGVNDKENAKADNKDSEKGYDDITMTSL